MEGLLSFGAPSHFGAYRGNDLGRDDRLVEGSALVPRCLGVLSLSCVQLSLLLPLRLLPRLLHLFDLALPVLHAVQAIVRRCRWRGSSEPGFICCLT